jgi:hypothetical protein
MDTSQLELHAHLKIRPGQLDGFKKQAAECEDHFMTFYGEVSPELFDMGEAMQKAGHVRVTWFDFFQGLESPASV